MTQLAIAGFHPQRLTHRQDMLKRVVQRQWQVMMFVAMLGCKSSGPSAKAPKDRQAQGSEAPAPLQTKDEKGPSAEECREAVENARKVSGIEDKNAPPNWLVKRCQEQGSKEATVCARRATTKMELARCDSAGTPRLALDMIEATAVAAEFMLGQRMYVLEHGHYLSTGTSESDLHPKVVANVAMAVSPMPESWTALRLPFAHDKFHCGAVAIAGTSSDKVGPLALEAGVLVPDTDWHYLVIRCPTTKQTFVVTFEEDEPKLTPM